MRLLLGIAGLVFVLNLSAAAYTKLSGFLEPRSQLAASSAVELPAISVATSTELEWGW